MFFFSQAFLGSLPLAVCIFNLFVNTRQVYCLKCTLLVQNIDCLLKSYNTLNGVLNLINVNRFRHYWELISTSYLGERVSLGRAAVTVIDKYKSQLFTPHTTKSSRFLHTLVLSSLLYQPFT